MVQREDAEPGMKVVLSQINFTWGSASTMSVTYTAVLPVREETVDFLTGLLADDRVRRCTRADSRSLCCQFDAIGQRGALLRLRSSRRGWSFVVRTGHGVGVVCSQRVPQVSGPDSWSAVSAIRPGAASVA